MEEDGSANSLFVIDGVAGGGGGSSNTDGTGTKAVAQDYASESDGEEDAAASAVEAAAESLDDAMAQLQQLQQMQDAMETQAAPASDVGGAAGALGYVKAGVEQDGQPVGGGQGQAPQAEQIGVEEEEGYLSDE